MPNTTKAVHINLVNNIQPLVGQVMSTDFWERKNVTFLDVLESDKLSTLIIKSQCETESLNFQILIKEESHDNARHYNNLNTIDQTANVVWSVLLQTTYCLDLVPSDFHLFWADDRLYRQYFPDNSYHCCYEYIDHIHQIFISRA